MTVVELGRKRPHLYQLMFAIPKSDPGAGARAASRAQEEFLSIVAAVVGEADARHYGALLFSSAHGIAELEISGHLTEERWDNRRRSLVNLGGHDCQPPPGEADHHLVLFEAAVAPSLPSRTWQHRARAARHRTSPAGLPTRRIGPMVWAQVGGVLSGRDDKAVWSVLTRTLHRRWWVDCGRNRPAATLGSRNGW